MTKALPIFLLALAFSSANTRNLHPCILVPGILETPFNANITKEFKLNSICQDIQNGEVRLWLSPGYVLSHSIECVFEGLKLEYNSSTRTTSDMPGVNLNIPAYNSTNTVASVDNGVIRVLIVFKKIIDKLKEDGYVPDVSVFGFGYDWRKGPYELQSYCKLYIQLIENAYNRNQKQKVIIMLHSMGALVTKLCLSTVSQAWKDTYVGIIISISGAWGGSLVPTDAYQGFRIYAGEFGLYLTPSNSITTQRLPIFNTLYGAIPANLTSVQLVPADIIKNFLSLMWLSPSPFAFDNKTLIQTTTKFYTAATMRDYYKDAGGEVGAQQYDDIYPFIANLNGTGVPTYCLFGSNINTISRIKYQGADVNSTKAFPELGNGDGLVNEEGLAYCMNSAGGKQVQQKTYPGLNHNALLYSDTVIQDIRTIIKNYTAYQNDPGTENRSEITLL